MTEQPSRRALFGLFAGASALAIAGPLIGRVLSNYNPSPGPMAKSATGFVTSDLIPVTPGGLYTMTMDKAGRWSAETTTVDYTIDDDGDLHFTAPPNATHIAWNLRRAR